MALPADYHLHTPLCRHARGRPIELAAQAVAVGLTEIGFSDHAPMPRDDFDDWRMNSGQLDEYVVLVEQARQAYPDLVIKLALEVDFIPGAEEWIKALADRHPWDYLIGSVHYLSADWAIDNPQQIGAWKNHNPFEVWTRYFERLTLAAESDLFEIIGHADLCKKFCFYPREDCTPLYRRFLEAARNHGVALELNTAGLRKDCREIYPGRALLQMAAKLDIPITFGSDAHAPEEVGLGLNQAVEQARAAGYTRCRRFTRRRAQETPL
jgi:histidinol-phosphatase (PHP family)